ncbi:MAG: 3-isopropylmalate dehydratase small subunit [Tagaea sp.]|nr:3-isopropylmalate dehydratase small subunit [Tagaea sp.]
MEKFVRHEGPALAIPIDHVDTDAMFPARFGATVSRAGFAEAFFADWRADPAFPLAAPEAKRATILAVGANYGCGSSREHAVWAHLQWGVRAVLGPSFADIFVANALKNGLLPVTLPEAAARRLLADLAAAPLARIAVDLARDELRLPDGSLHPIPIDPRDREALLNGWDAIDRTLAHETDLAAFAARDRQARPWAWR